MGNSSSSSSSASSSSASSSAHPERHFQTSASFRTFRDSYTDVAALQADLRRAGLESCNLIVGIDMTKSNEWTGKESFQGRNLHAISPYGTGVSNPYETAISIIGNTLAPFDEDGLIPAYMFGCIKSRDRDLTCLKPHDTSCNGFLEVLQRYRDLVPATPLSGPTSFGPLIRHACDIVKKNNGQYHILCIIADGQVSRSSDLGQNELSDQERDTINAIVDASQLALSIIMIGVGDGPWEQMEEFDDRIPDRAFDNFQFVPLNSTLANALARVPAGSTSEQVKSAMDATFALHALMEVPEQFREIGKRGIMSAQSASKARIRGQGVRVFDPPVVINNNMMMGVGGAGGGGGVPQVQQQQQFQFPAYMNAGGMPAMQMPYQQQPQFPQQQMPVPAPMPIPVPAPAPAPAAAAAAAEECVVCMERPLNMAFQCGHRTCNQCGPQLTSCPVCRLPVQTRIRLY